MGKRLKLLGLAAAAVIVVVVVALPWGVPVALWSWSRETVHVGDQKLVVVGNRGGNGMVGLSDLGSIDGMLFEFSQPSDPDSGFGWQMLDVPIPLEIAYFAPSGALLGIQKMEPCAAEPCPVYEWPEPYQWVIETEVGTLTASPGDILRWP